MRAQRNAMARAASIVAAIIAGTLLLAGCEVDQTEEGDMPEVEVEGGKMPEYDVEGPDVDVGTEEEQVTVPDVDVETEEETVTVPDVDVELPENDDKP